MEIFLRVIISLRLVWPEVYALVPKELTAWVIIFRINALDGLSWRIILWWMHQVVSWLWMAPKLQGQIFGHNRLTWFLGWPIVFHSGRHMRIMIHCRIFGWMLVLLEMECPLASEQHKFLKPLPLGKITPLPGHAPTDLHHPT